ncbi:protein-(glutamine-N5) methyltransferase, release factor-specific [Rhodovibrio sodomensis]|uniref:Release factor glutamine methyltransferase n=1 Tax=Rhodovibrio sodomensis TaxID=1088 RepID=A0ABS1DM86_9PROT|nr:peptide chain release factor N(5)-glutamine methyltransferase [Rhodovibrio sodomensis]MBK1670490.1 protein-(glutamine-N5) methyltransferase, release factor-specific [Rhodovibrio sodomensis]
MLRAAAERLATAGVDAPRRDARALLAAAAGHDEAALLASPELGIARDAAERFRSFVDRRAARMPVARILGAREFWSLNLAIGPAVLDPRPDSETLVEAALAHVDASPAGRAGGWRVLDLGTGSGCLLLALLSELPRATGVGLERDADAAALARANAARHGLDARAAIRRDGWAELDAGARFDLIVANPPYIPTDEIAQLGPEVARYDPAGALDGGPDGLDAYRDLVPRLAGWLAPGGQAFLEVGHDQGRAVQDLLRAAGLRLPAGVCDLAGTLRCVRAAGP